MPLLPAPAHPGLGTFCWPWGLWVGAGCPPPPAGGDSELGPLPPLWEECVPKSVRSPRCPQAGVRPAALGAPLVFRVAPEGVVMISAGHWVPGTMSCPPPPCVAAAVSGSSGPLLPSSRHLPPEAQPLPLGRACSQPQGRPVPRPRPGSSTEPLAPRAPAAAPALPAELSPACLPPVGVCPQERLLDRACVRGPGEGSPPPCD